MVTRRVAPILVALAIALGPVALDVCQARCVRHAAAEASAASAEAHACHHAAVPAPSPDARAMRGLPSACAHADGLTPSTQNVLRANLVAPATVPVVWQHTPALEPSRAAITPTPSPPRTVSAGQLRV